MTSAFSPYRHYPKRIEERNPNTGRFDRYIVWDSHGDTAATTKPVDRKTACAQARSLNKQSSIVWTS